ncbi:hypothetical protein [Cellulomonas persica]|nr:hypothetical protein [Cellulomonas persica]
MADPSGVLVPPSDDAIIPDLAELVISGMGTLLSPTGWVRTILSMCGGWDPLTEALKGLSGDWNAVAQAARGYQALDTFLDEVATELSVETRKVLADWEGNAANACDSYMVGTLVPALTELSTAVRNVGDQYQAVAVGMHRTAMVANDAINFAIDWIIYTAAIAAATAASSWTVVGGIAGGAATAAAVVQTIRAISSASTALSAGQVVIDAAAGFIPGYLGAIHGFADVALPAAYDHPGATR